MEPEVLLPNSQHPATCPCPEPDESSPCLLIFSECSRTCETFCKIVRFYGEELLAPPNTHVGGPPIVGCPRLLLQYVRSYPPYLQAVPPPATWGRAMPWWQGRTYHGAMPWWQGRTYHGAMPWWQGRTYHGAMPWWQGRTYHGAMPWWQGRTCHGTKRYNL
jgi:hypothetical protein